MKRLFNLIALLIIAAGFFILIDPFIRQGQREHNAKQAVETFKLAAQDVKNENITDISSYAEEADGESSVPENSESSVPENSESSVDGNSWSSVPAKEQVSEGNKRDHYIELYKKLCEYNKIIFKSNQSELRDAFSYMTSSIRFTDFGLPCDTVGYITIEKMNVELPMYIGSSSANMAIGATIMDHTSMPIGGQNTNCVIAAHRMGGFFGDIELLQIGDLIRITNLWETLTYRVAKITVIDPYDTDKIKIIPGKDMITLLTCHPYWSNRTRYIVYCERTFENAEQHDVGKSTADSSADTAENIPQVSEGSALPDEKEEEVSVQLPDGEEFAGSQSVIELERVIRISGAVFAVILMIFCIAGLFRKQ